MIKISFNRFLVLIFFFVLSICYSQNSVSGYVVDEHNSPIELANVFIQNVKTSHEIFGSTTAPDGTFLISLNENQKEYKIIVSFIGYETWTKLLIIEGTTDLNKIILKEKSSELDEVIITSKIPTIIKKKDKIIFNVQNSPLNSGYDGIELLKNSPAVWVDNDDNILIRNEIATILINGRKINMSGDNLTTYLNSLNSDAIKSIEIQTAKGANTEAASSGGIINIVLKERALGITSQINLGYVIKRDNYFSLYPSLNASYGSEKWNIYGSYNLSVRNDYTELTNDVYFNDLNRQNNSERIQEDNTNRNHFKFGFLREINKKHDLGIEVFGSIYANDYTDYGKALYYLENNLNDKGVNNTLGNTYKNSINGVLNHYWKISPKDKLSTFIDYSTSKSNDESKVITTYEESTFVDNIGEYKSDTETTTYAIQTDYSTTLKNEAKFDLGVKYTYSNRENSLIPKYFEDSIFVINAEQLSDFNYKENVFAAYFSFDKTFKEKNYIKIGARMENTYLNKTNYIDNSSIKQNYTSLFPSLYYSRKIADQKTMSVSYSRSLRRPSFRDLNNDVIKINDFQLVLGNPDLQPEFIDKCELSYQLQKNNFALFYSKTKEAINGVYFLEDNVAYYKKFNAGSQIQYGIEYSTSQKINNWWYLNVSSYCFNRKFVDKQKESMFEKVTLGMKFYNNFKINKTTSLDLTANYRSPKSDAFYEASEYYSVNLGFKKSLFNKKVSLRIDVRDLLNSLEYRNKREFSNYTTVANTKPITRFLYLKLTYNFSNNGKILGKKNKSKNENYRRL